MYRSVLRPIAFLCGLIALAAYATIMMRGPQGLGALDDKRKAVQQLEEQNATLIREIDDNKKLIDKLQHDPGTQERYIRERTGKTHAGDTTFVVPGPAAKP